MADIFDILTQLTGASQAALGPSSDQLLRTPPFLPGPVTPPFVPQLPTPNLPPVATPGEEGSSALALPPISPVDLAGALARARTATTGILGPEPGPPVPGPGGVKGFLQGLAGALQQGVQAGFTENPGATLLALQQQARTRAEREQEQSREERQRRQALTAQIYSSEVADERRARLEEAREQRNAEREFQRYVRDQQTLDKRIGAQTDLEELKQKFEQAQRDAKEAEAQRKAAEAQQRADEKEVRVRTGQIYDDYKGGVPRQAAKQIAEFEVYGTPLSKEAQKTYNNAAKVKRGLGGVGPKGQQFIGQFESIKADYANAVARGDSTGENFNLKRLETLMKKAPADVEVGYDPTGKWPYAKIRGTNPGSPQATQQGPAPKTDPLGIR